jgi:hypothetical protein
MNINDIIKNEYIIGTIVLFVIVYSSLAATELPKWLVSLFKNDIFKVLFLSLLLIVPFETAPQIALIIALSFVLLSHSVNIYEKDEHFKKIEKIISNSK